MLGQDYFDLLTNFGQLSFQPPAPRETGLIQTPQMPWNSPQCRLGLEYKNIYISRMQKLRHRFNIPGIISIAQVIQNNQRYCISGTIKRLEVKRVRAFQKQFAEKYNNSDPLYDSLDQLEIEDHSGKLKINMNDSIMGNRKIKATDLPFGVQVVLQGKFKKHANKFAVKHVYLPHLSPQSNFIPNFVNREGVQFKDKKILVLSQPTKGQCEYVCNLLTKAYSQQIRSISALVIIGGMDMKIESIHSMANIVNSLKNTIDVFVMPSSNMDRRKMFPLQPYNGNFFSKSKNQIGLCCNPQEFNVQNGMKIHISCGQNVIDFMKNCSLAENELQVLQNMIYFSHYCPTAPFSLKTEPYIEDNLVMDEIPNIMIVGKAKTFGSRLLKVEGRQILLVTIPTSGMSLANDTAQMIKMPQTVGQLLENVEKAQFDQQSMRSNPGRRKHQHMDDDDVFTINNDNGYGVDVKTEVKHQYDYMKDQNEEQIILKSRPVTQILKLNQPFGNFKKPLKIQIDFIENPSHKKVPTPHFQKFRHEDVWDPSRQLRYKVSSDKICIANMVELPAQKHVLNKPKPYKPLQPLKKKMYRPPVPRYFRSGYDEFLSRREKNKKGDEIDLAVLNVDQVVEQCYKNGIIPLFIYNQFINRTGHLHIRRFLQKWVDGLLNQFDFERTCFTLLDHRRLSELLMHLYPKKYTLGTYQALHQDVKEFISRTYYLNNDDYVQAYLLLDQISECMWWSDIKARLENHQEIQHSQYFKVKQYISKPPLPAEMQYDKRKKSEYIRDLLGHINIQDSQRELQKILSMKYKNNPRGFTAEQSTTSYHRHDQDEQFEQSHDRNSEMSFNEPSVRGQKSGNGPDWSKLFNEDRQQELYEQE